MFLRRGRQKSQPTAAIGWLGIGAQRCGTTWFTDLLCEHPGVDLSPALDSRGIEHKELHILDRFGPSIDELSAQYCELFPPHGQVRFGEFSPSYLRAPWAAVAAQQLIPADCRVFVLLRDPVQRFRSAIDLKLDQHQVTLEDLPRELLYDAIWAGQYEKHLEHWQWLGTRLQLIFYEDLNQDPDRVMAEAWRFLGLDPVQLSHPDAASSTRVPPRFSIETVNGLESSLRTIYAPTREIGRGRW